MWHCLLVGFGGAASIWHSSHLIRGAARRAAAQPQESAFRVWFLGGRRQPAAASKSCAPIKGQLGCLCLCSSEVLVDGLHLLGHLLHHRLQNRSSVWVWGGGVWVWAAAGHLAGPTPGLGRLAAAQAGAAAAAGSPHWRCMAHLEAREAVILLAQRPLAARPALVPAADPFLGLGGVALGGCRHTPGALVMNSRSPGRRAAGGGRQARAPQAPTVQAASPSRPSGSSAGAAVLHARLLCRPTLKLLPNTRLMEESTYSPSSDPLAG